MVSDPPRYNSMGSLKSWIYVDWSQKTWKTHENYPNGGDCSERMERSPLGWDGYHHFSTMDFRVSKRFKTSHLGGVETSDSIVTPGNSAIVTRFGMEKSDRFKGCKRDLQFGDTRSLLITWPMHFVMNHCNHDHPERRDPAFMWYVIA